MEGVGYVYGKNSQNEGFDCLLLLGLLENFSSFCEVRLRRTDLPDSLPLDTFLLSPGLKPFTGTSPLPPPRPKVRRREVQKNGKQPSDTRRVSE